MPIRRTLLVEGLPPNPVLDPAWLALVGLYYQIASGVVVPAAHAASHAAGDSDAVTLTQAQITGLAAALALLAPLAGATFTGAVTLKGVLQINDAVNANERVKLQNTSQGHTNYPRATFQGGNSAADANWGMRFAADYSSSSVTIPVVFQISSNKDASYTNAKTLMFYQSGTIATLSTVSGVASDGTSLRIGTHSNVTLGALFIDTVAAGQGVAVDSSLKVGTSGTPITQTRVYTPSLTPSLIAGIGLSEEAFNVPGLATTDTISVNGPAPAAGTAPVAWRVSAADTLAIQFQTTAISLSPTAGVYRVIAHRS